MTKNKIRVAGAICALAVAGLAPGAASAQTASQDGYDESGLLGSVDQGGGGTPQSVSATDNGSSRLRDGSTLRTSHSGRASDAQHARR